MIDPFHVGILLFPNLTLQDAIGPYQAFARTPGFTVHMIARTMEPVPDQHGLQILPTTDFQSAPKLDLLCVPGGYGEADAYEDPATLEYVRKVAGEAQFLTSVCTGSLILGAAGLLRGRRATCHWSALELLALFGAEPVAERVVEDGTLITGGGVTAGLDFALHVIARLKGEGVAQGVQLSMEYAPQPPFDAGRPETAPAEVLEKVEESIAAARANRRARAEAAAQRLDD